MTVKNNVTGTNLWVESPEIGYVDEAIGSLSAGTYRRLVRRIGCYRQNMTQLRISEVAELLAVSDDTVRRWSESGRLRARQDDSGRWVIDGRDLAYFMVAQRAGSVEGGRANAEVRISARNRFEGLVTSVTKGDVMAQVEIQAGPHRVVSLISREAADELGLEPGVRATATVKATDVGVETAVRSDLA
jgi:molybdopterin-binding protein